MQLHGAGAAGHALAAGFIPAEGHEEGGDAHHVGVVVHHHHAAGTHDRAQLLQALVIHRRVEQGGRHAAAGGTAGLHGLDGGSIRAALPHLGHDRGQAGAHRHFHQPAPAHIAGEAKHLGALAAGGTDGGEPSGALAQDRHHVGERFDVVDQGRQSPYPRFSGVWGARPRCAALTLDRVDQGRFLAADIGAGANPQLHREAEGAAEQPRSEQLAATGLLDRPPQVDDRQLVLGADVDEAPIGPHCVGGDRHALQHAVRITLQHAAVHEGAGVALIGIADNHLALTRHLGHRCPFQTGGIAGAATAAQAAAADRLDHLGRGALLHGAAQLLVGAALDRRFDPLRVDQAAVLQHDAPLPREEGPLGVDLLSRNRGPGQGRLPLGGRGCLQTLGQGRDQPVGIGGRHPGEQGTIGINRQQRALAAGAEAAHAGDGDAFLQLPPGHSRGQRLPQLGGASNQAAGGAAAAHPQNGAGGRGEGGHGCGSDPRSSSCSAARPRTAARTEPTVWCLRTSPSITTTGAALQVPKQRTDPRLTQPSARQAPRSICNSCSRASIKAAAPFTSQAVPLQTTQLCRAGGRKRNR